MKKIDINEIIEAVKQAGAIALDGARKKDVKQKGDADFITDSDLAVQNFLRDRLKNEYPEIEFLSEEAADIEIDMSRPVWVLDPIDGTMNFIRDLSLSAVSLALVEGGETVIGVVYNPFRDELFYAEKGRGAYLNGEKIRVSTLEGLSGALVAVGTAPYYKPGVADCFDIYRELFLKGVDIRRLGSAAIDICYVAAGRFDLYYEYVLSIWDYAAARLILTEAGGRITNVKGEQTAFERKSPIVASNAKLHEEVMGIINSYLK